MLFSRIRAHLQQARQDLPVYLTFRAPPVVRMVMFWPYYHRCIPRRQDAPILVYTMGKVATISLERSLRQGGWYFTFATHRMRPWIRCQPFFTFNERLTMRWQGVMRVTGYRWLKHTQRVRVVTAVRDPIARLLSLYLYTYRTLFGEPVEQADMATLLERFPRMFDREYVHPLVPGEFFDEEIRRHLGIDVLTEPFDAARGWAVIERGAVSLLVLKAELPDAEKASACGAWLGREVPISRHNTAADRGQGDVMAEFRRRVRFPRAYAEAMRRSRFMRHFYTAEEVAAWWRRWEAQLDDAVALPAWLVASLDKHHPRVE